jgi:hypothetical protein
MVLSKQYMLKFILQASCSCCDKVKLHMLPMTAAMKTASKCYRSFAHLAPPKCSIR